ncbi:MAG TPA: glycoside hydrolase family 30 beta sandwich domain-containing protein [Candidatus Sulfotelmatobacter sp.]|nr:glycoside hydrolase family 30 beta sandwich domain-containing protein [Candidatus Sulfotelmatobacter sp.]
MPEPGMLRDARTNRQFPGDLRVFQPLLLCVGCLVLAGCPNSSQTTQTTAGGAQVQIVETTGDRTMLLQTQPSLKFTAGGNSGGEVITVDATTQYQQMDGFGGSLTDSSAWLIWNKLNASQQSALMQQLFSPSAGIGISFLRQPMGATDFSASGNYSYDDMAAGKADPNLTKFSVAHDATYIIPLVKQALSINRNLKVVALPWSPPAWMKASGTMNGGNMNSAYFPSLAQYFVNFVQAYQQQGIPIYGVSVQNEPLYSTTGYPSEYLTAGDEASFIANNLGPALNRAGLGNVKIFGYEHNWDNTAYAETVLGGAAQYVAGSSFHCYAGDPGAQSTVRTAFPAKDIWFTECSGITSSNFPGDLVWNAEHLLIGATRNWARSVSIWNVALDQNSGPKNGTCANCRGVVTIDDSASPATISFNVEYYVLGHLGKFVVPGAHRIDSNTFGAGSIEDVAFRNPDRSIVLLVLNAAGNAAAFNVSFKGQSFNYTLPAGAVATFIWKSE